MPRQPYSQEFRKPSKFQQKFPTNVWSIEEEGTYPQFVEKGDRFNVPSGNSDRQKKKPTQRNQHRKAAHGSSLDYSRLTPALRGGIFTREQT